MSYVPETQYLKDELSSWIWALFPANSASFNLTNSVDLIESVGFTASIIFFSFSLLDSRKQDHQHNQHRKKILLYTSSIADKEIEKVQWDGQAEELLSGYINHGTYG